MSQIFIGYPTITTLGVQTATGAASATVTLPLMSSSEVPRYIRLSATAACCVRLFPAAGGNATNADTQIQPGDSLILSVPNGYTKLAAIQQAAAGILQISALENM